MRTITQADIDANAIVSELGGQVGDTIIFVAQASETITVTPDAPAVVG